MDSRARSIKTRIETCFPGKSSKLCDYSRARSIKTRIETYKIPDDSNWTYEIREQDPLKQGLKL